MYPFPDYIVTTIIHTLLSWHGWSAMCWFSVGPASQTVLRYWTCIGLVSRVRWVDIILPCLYFTLLPIFSIVSVLFVWPFMTHKVALALATRLVLRGSPDHYITYRRPADGGLVSTCPGSCIFIHICIGIHFLGCVDARYYRQADDIYITKCVHLLYLWSNKRFFFFFF